MADIEGDSDQINLILDEDDLDGDGNKIISEEQTNELLQNDFDSDEELHLNVQDEDYDDFLNRPLPSNDAATENCNKEVVVPQKKDSKPYILKPVIWDKESNIKTSNKKANVFKNHFQERKREIFHPARDKKQNINAQQKYFKMKKVNRKTYDRHLKKKNQLLPKEPTNFANQGASEFSFKHAYLSLDGDQLNSKTLQGQEQLSKSGYDVFGRIAQENEASLEPQPKNKKPEFCYQPHYPNSNSGLQQQTRNYSEFQPFTTGSEDCITESNISKDGKKLFENLSGMQQRKSASVFGGACGEEFFVDATQIVNKRMKNTSAAAVAQGEETNAPELQTRGGSQITNCFSLRECLPVGTGIPLDARFLTPQPTPGIGSCQRCVSMEDMCKLCFDISARAHTTQFRKYV